MTMNLYYGTVIASDDGSHLGQVKVRILPEMEEVPDALLPWVSPFSTPSMSQEAFAFEAPEAGSPVWVIFLDEFFKQGFYVSAAFVTSYFDFTKISSALSGIEGIDSQTVKQGDLRFTRYEDGSIIFRNVKTGESGFYHQSGSYTLFDKDGGVHTYGAREITAKTSQSEINILENGNVEITAGGTGSVAVDGQALTYDGDYLVRFSDLQAILSGLNTFMKTFMMVDPLSGVTGTMSPPHWDMAVATLLTDIQNMKTQKVGP